MAVNWDKLSAGLDAALVTLFAIQGRGRSGGFPSSSNNGPAPKGFFVTLLSFIVRIWEESGGSMKDESELIESLYGSNEKSQKLNVAERKKIAAVLAAMTETERKVFRIAIYIMDPEISTVEVAEVTNKDGKVVTPATTRTEKTGVDPRVNVLRGIAEMVLDDLSNAKAVAETLRDAGALGSDNKALAHLKKVQEAVIYLLCTLFGVKSPDLITKEFALAKFKELINKLEKIDPTKPKEGDTAGMFVRNMRNITMGSFPNSERNPRRGLQPRIKAITSLILVVAIALITLVFVIGSARTTDRSLLNQYDPTETSVQKPAE